MAADGAADGQGVLEIRTDLYLRPDGPIAICDHVGWGGSGQVRYRYTLEERSYHDRVELPMPAKDALEVGQRFALLYDPLRPRRHTPMELHGMVIRSV